MSSEISIRPARRRGLTAAIVALLLGITPPAALADGRAAGPAKAGQTLGPVTNLPLPRFVSLKASKGNVRRGPGLTQRIDWVFKRRNMPLEITAEFGHWRRVRDRDGAGGWIHFRLLSGVRTVLVDQDMLALYAKPDPKAALNARLELGVVARLGKCTPKWCRIRAGGYSGWTLKTALWGVKMDEIRN